MADDDRIETVPITEQIASRVAEAVADSEAESFMEAGTLDVVRPEPPLELDAPDEPPKPPPADFPPPLAELHARRKRRIRLTIAAIVIGLAAAGTVLFTKIGRSVLPAEMQRPARQLADDVERRASEARGEALYTFTDDDGVVHIVDAFDKIPPKYRSRARRQD